MEMVAVEKDAAAVERRRKMRLLETSQHFRLVAAVAMVPESVVEALVAAVAVAARKRLFRNAQSVMPRRRLTWVSLCKSFRRRIEWCLGTLAVDHAPLNYIHT
jgi:hypothetical protein